MNSVESAKNPPEGAVSFSGDIHSWINLLENGLNVEPGTVLLFLGGQRPLDRLAAGWHLAVATAINTQSGARYFSSVEHIVPKELINRDVPANIKLAIEEQLVGLGWSREQINTLIGRMMVHHLSAFEGSTVLEVLNHMQEGAAVAVSRADIYRFHDIKRKPSTSAIRTWPGILNEFTSKETVFFEHLMDLTRQTLEVARQKRLFVTLFCECDLVETKLPPDLQNNPNLVVVHLANSREDGPSLMTTQDWLAKLDTEGIDSVLATVTASIEDPIQRALLASFLLSAAGQFSSAWKEIEPHIGILTQSEGVDLIPLSNLAVNAGRSAEGAELLRIAAKRGITWLEELKSAYRLAETLGLYDLRDSLIDQMYSSYPKDQMAADLFYNKYILARDFSSALQLAERSEDEFGVRLCRAFIDPDFDLTELLSYAERTGQAERAYIAAAYEAEAQNRNILAKELASRIGPASEFASDAAQIRIRMIGILIRAEGEISDDQIAELKRVLEFAATRPDDADVRLQVYELLESGLEQPAVVFMLSTILSSRIATSFEAAVSTDSPLGRSQSEEPQESEHQRELENLVTQFMKEFLSSQGSVFMVGQGALPDHLKPLVSPALLDFLIRTLRYGLKHVVDNDLDFILRLLHTIILVSREVGDLNRDLLAVRIAIGYLANAGYAQQARDLAESSLLTMVDPRSDYYAWRIGQAWACLADAFHRTGNTVAALRSLCLSFLSWDGPAPYLLILRSSYRLAARIFRDIGYTEYALEIVNMERRLALIDGAGADTQDELDEVEFSIRVTGLRSNTSADDLIKLLAKASDLLHRRRTDEVALILSLQATLIRYLKLAGAQIPKDLEDEFAAGLEKLSEPQRDTIKSLSIASPSKSDLLSAVQRAATSKYWDDLAYQIAPISNLASTAAESAAQQGDIDLFILASALLSQPVLSLSALEGEHSNPTRFPDMLIAQRWFIQLAKSNQNSAVLQDAHDIAQQMIPPPTKTIKQLSEVSLGQLQSVIDSDEVVMILVRDHLGGLCRAAIYPDHYLGPESLGEEIWSSAKFAKWRMVYPRAYGDWNPAPADLSAEEQPSPDEVMDSVASLSIGEFAPAGLISVVPDAGLFGFPFVLTPKDGVHLGEDVPLAIAPSAPWLIATRSQPWAGNSLRKAWLGSPKSDDFVLHFLRDRLEPILEEYQFENIQTDLPDGLAKSSLALIVSHGGTGIFDQFRTVTDRIAAYSAEAFAKNLEGCGCVLLFVCNAGRSDPELGSSETLGVVSELLKLNVRSVVAPPWPLHLDVATVWLPPFLRSLSDGHPVAYSAHQASRKVREKYDNPCAWGALQVYGDATYTLP
jgi:hypothetical protein